MPGYEIIGEEERNEISQIFENGSVLFRHGFEAKRNGCFKVKEFETSFAKKLEVNHSLAVTSGTAALRVALASIGVKSGDEVITQCFTFVATAEAIIESGATPICTEIDKTLNMDPKDLIKKISTKTKAVIAVHMLGVPARLKEIKDICDSYKIALIEDTAWGCGGKLEGKTLGTWGQLGTYSFDYAKTITTGEGGMIVTNDKEIWERASEWHDHGHKNNPDVPRWRDDRTTSGFNYRMMEIQGAIGLAQLRKLDFILKRQRTIFRRIWDSIKETSGVELREEPHNSQGTADALVFFVPTKNTALHCREKLLEYGVSTKILPEAITWHFAGEWEHIEGLKDFQASRDILSRAVSLPISLKQDDKMIDSIKKAVAKALSHQ